MKLTLHQEKIIEAIIDGDVYDITSYLAFFNKAHHQQYDLDEINSVFEKCEDGQTYNFRLEQDSYYYTDVYDKNGVVCNTMRAPNKTTHEFRDNPISSPVKAHLQESIDIEKCSYLGKNYSFDFLKKSYPVADSFEDVIDFITLWSYLKREALILEVNKPVQNEDISLFFELQRQDLQPNFNPYWTLNYELISESSDTTPGKLRTHFAPTKKAMNYIENVWKLNEEHFLTCNEFIGKKIIASSELRVYKQKKFKTVEQISQYKNLFVAWVAVGISVLSILFGNILPLFQNKTDDYLFDLKQSMTAIEQSIENDVSNAEIITELKEIIDSLDEISKSETSEDTLKIVEELKKQVYEINKYLQDNN